MFWDQRLDSGSQILIFDDNKVLKTLKTNSTLMYILITQEH